MAISNGAILLGAWRSCAPQVGSFACVGLRRPACATFSGRGSFSGKSLQLFPGKARHSILLSGQFSGSDDRRARQGSPDKDERGDKAAHGDRVASAVRTRRSRGIRGASFNNGIATPPTTLCLSETRQI